MNPLETVGGTIAAGFALTALLYIVVSLIVP